MTSREFIQRQFGNNDGKEKWCSSILKAANGDIYSYGYHYPLLFTINGQVFRNVRGYSVTTAKHIGWCYGFGALSIEVDTFSNFNYLDDDQKLHAIYVTMGKKAENLRKQLESKKRKDTQIYESLEAQLNDTIFALDKVRSLMYEVARG